jgi:hypothetical protein
LTVLEERARRHGHLVGPVAPTAAPAAPGLRGEDNPPAAVPDSGAHRQAVLRDAILRTLAYADLFDWPLTASEIHRYLPIPASEAEIAGRVASPDAGWSTVDTLIMLGGREPLVATRRRRAAASARIWPTALRAAGAVGAMPFVRLVAVTGSLAVDAADSDADVDLFIVTADGRLWLSRAATIGIGRLAGHAGITLCPNYLLAESALELAEHDRFTAHELAQMVPVTGAATYRDLLARNAWYRAFLPNHQPAPRAPQSPARARQLAERALRTLPVDALERWEMRRKTARLAAGATSPEQRFDAMSCKGHFDEHRRRVLERYSARVAELGLGLEPDLEPES